MTAAKKSPVDDGYNEVADRVKEFRAKHPEGSLQPANLDKPYEVLTIGDKTFIVYAAAAYRTPDDPRPGIGLAYEPFPGPTNFTRDSELQNAETSAWGRAIVAVLAADAKKIASADEVRNRQAGQPKPADPGKLAAVENLYDALPAGSTTKTKAELVAFAAKSDANADATITKLQSVLDQVDAAQREGATS